MLPISEVGSITLQTNMTMQFVPDSLAGLSTAMNTYV
jgi:hypothetical protein